MIKQCVSAVMLFSLLVPGLASAEEVSAGTSATESVSPTVTNAGNPQKPLNAPKRMMPSGERPSLESEMERRKQLMMTSSTTIKRPLPPNGAVQRERPVMGSGTPVREHVGEKLNERRDAMKERMVERKINSAKEFIKQVVERVRNAIDRLTKLADRLEQAHVKLKEKGVDVSHASSLLASAQTKIADATSALEKAKSVLDAAKPTSTGTSTSDISDTGRQAARDALKAAEDAVKAAHKALVEAIAATKAAGGANGKSPIATSSQQVTP